ncbi:MAG: riboflavin synthase [Ferruginibacter sp.]
MFTGIIEQTGIIKRVMELGSNSSFWIQSALAPELKVDQSLSHNGVCLTIEEINGDEYRVTAIDETIQKTTLGKWKTADSINLERCMQMNGRLDGHIVQGHVDTVATCMSCLPKDGSWEYRFSIDAKFAGLMIEKGSITLNGISLTIFNVANDSFMVAIIPYTYDHTNLQFLKEGNEVNIEFDMIGKYVNRLIKLG